MDDRSTNVALEGFLRRAGLSMDALGREVNAVGLANGLGPRLVNPRGVWRWVKAPGDRDRPVIPRQPVPALVCYVLEARLGEPVTPDDLGWPDDRQAVPATHGLTGDWSAAGVLAALCSVVDAWDMERRDFLALTGAGLTSAAAAWLLEPARVAAAVQGKRIDGAFVSSLATVAAEKRRMDDTGSGGALLSSVHGDLHLVVSLIKNASYTEDVGRGLYGIAGEFGRLAGWLAYDRNRSGLAQRYFSVALRSAHLSGDKAVGANILGFMSIQVARSSAPAAAVDLAQTGLQSERHLTPAVAASLHARLAQGAARTGDYQTFRRAQERSFELLATSKPEEEPDWIYWHNAPNSNGIAGRSLLFLGRYAEADEYLRRSLSLASPDATRDRAMWLCNRAEAQVRDGRVEQASFTATEAVGVIRRLDSPRAVRQLDSFRAAAQPYAQTSAVKDFDAKYRQLVRPNARA